MRFHYRLACQGLLIALAFGSIEAAVAEEVSPADCAALADRASRDQRTVLGGAARSATKGAIFGAIVGDSSKGAKRGAAIGAVVGGARSAGKKNETYERAFDDCMRGRSPK